MQHILRPPASSRTFLARVRDAPPLAQELLFAFARIVTTFPGSRAAEPPCIRPPIIRIPDVFDHSFSRFTTCNRVISSLYRPTVPVSRNIPDFGIICLKSILPTLINRRLINSPFHFESQRVEQRWTILFAAISYRLILTELQWERWKNGNVKK